MKVTTVGAGILNRMIGWLRAGYPQVAPQRGHNALLALYSAEPSAARVLRLHTVRAGAGDHLRA
ncbi:MAG TPA: DUF3349 domain-containing protein [Mycobacterium sp.]|nr:DUF3349 domain-containing protein [Mycobacterium sp.]